MKQFNKLQLFLSACSVVFLVAIVGVCGLQAYKNLDTSIEAVADVVEGEEVVVEEEGETVDIYADLMALVEVQAQADLDMQAALADTSYTAQNPYVVLNPYSNSPLTAVIIFTTEETCSVSIEIVDGLDENSGDAYDFSEMTTQHVVPVYGLYANTTNVVSYTLANANGVVSFENTVEIVTEDFTNGLENIIINANVLEEGYTEGVNFSYTNNDFATFAFDENGEVRWYLTDLSITQSNEFSDGHFFFPTTDYTYMVEVDKLGKLYTVYTLDYGAHHDIETMDNGNYLITGDTGVGFVYEDFIYEINGETGDVVNTLDLKEVFSRNRLAYNIFNGVLQRDGDDWMHNNSISWIEEDQAIIISGNFQNIVAKISWPSGEIEWILADDMDWMTYYEQFLLTPIGDDFEFTYNQHAAYVLPDLDNDPNTIDITVFDNGSARIEYSAEFLDLELDDERYSRIVHYRIYQDTMEVEQIFEYGKERGEELYSMIRGDVDYLEETSNYLGTFDRYQPENLAAFGTYPALVEVDGEGNVIWEAEYFANDATGHVHSYQTDRLPLYFDTDTYQDIETSCVVLD